MEGTGIVFAVAVAVAVLLYRCITVSLHRCVAVSYAVIQSMNLAEKWLLKQKGQFLSQILAEHNDDESFSSLYL